MENILKKVQKMKCKRLWILKCNANAIIGTDGNNNFVGMQTSDLNGTEMSKIEVERNSVGLLTK